MKLLMVGDMVFGPEFLDNERKGQVCFIDWKHINNETKWNKVKDAQRIYINPRA